MDTVKFVVISEIENDFFPEIFYQHSFNLSEYVLYVSETIARICLEHSVIRLDETFP